MMNSKAKPKSKRKSSTRPHVTLRKGAPTPHDRVRKPVERAVCTCRCGEAVRPGSRFRPGHDMRMREGSKWRAEHPELFQD
jgi:hypothetical protein